LRSEPPDDGEESDASGFTSGQPAPLHPVLLPSATSKARPEPNGFETRESTFNQDRGPADRKKLVQAFDK
jgi:hypothetical protein